tara:strand:- start:88 stop:2166 length:2079 start_codon:yes stop_codon:yes gene_type:complete
MADKTPSEALLGGIQKGLKPFEIDPKTNRKTMFPDRFTLLDAQLHYNENNDGKISIFNPKGGLKEFKDITIGDIATNPKELLEAVITKIRQGGGSAEVLENKQRTAFANLRLVIGESTILLPDSFDNLLSFLPTASSEHPNTIRFFQGNSTLRTKTEANYAIRDNPEVIRTWFEGLETHATEKAADRPIVEAIKFGANTGFRPSLIEALQKNNVNELEDGTIMLVYQTSATGVKDSATKGGGRKGSKIWRVPLNKEAGDIVRERLQVLKSVGLEGKTDKLFFLDKPTKNNVTSVTTTHMNRVLGEVTSEGIIEDLDSLDPNENRGIRYDSLHIDKADRSKSGSQMLRNMHTHLAHRAGLDPRTIDYLQGRVSEQSINQKLGYLKPASDATPPDNVLAELSKWGTYFNKIGVSQKDYQPGAIGTNQINDNIVENAQKASLQSTSKADAMVSAKADANLGNRQAVRDLATEKLGVSDPSYLSEISNIFPTPQQFTSFIDYQNTLDTPSNLSSPTELLTAFRNYKQQTSSTPTVGGMKMLADQEQASIKQSTATPSWRIGREYDSEGVPIRTEEQRETTLERARLRGIESRKKRLENKNKYRLLEDMGEKPVENIEAEIAPSDVAAKPDFFSDEEVSKRQGELFDQVTDILNPNPLSKLKLGVKIAKTIGKAFKAKPPKAKSSQIEPPKDKKKKP